MTRKIVSFAAAAVFSIALVACGGSSTTAPEKSAETVTTQKTDARLIAALSYADWCGSCKTLDPKIQEARTGDDLGAAFVTLDYTARDDAAFFAAADAAGIGGAVREKYAAGVKTGQLLLIDVDDAKIVGVITKDMSVAEIAEAIEIAATDA